MTQNSLGPDPSQWSNARMTSFGMSVGSTVGAAMAAILVNAAQANKRSGRVLSAKAIRMTEEEVHALELHLSSLLLKHRLGQVGELQRELAEAQEALAYERYLNSRRN